MLFNVPKPIDAMFYSGYTAYERMPTESEVNEIRAQGRTVLIYQRSGTPVTIPASWRVAEVHEER